MRSTEDDTKEQYEQRVGQNGMETYRLNDSGRERDKIFCSFPMVMRLNSVFSALTSQSCWKLCKAASSPMRSARLRNSLIGRTPVTVSYTHLDVYKRQTLISGIPTNR